MNPAAEFSAAFQEPHIILGLRLLPLSLGRYQLLKRFNCPFVSDEPEQVGLEKLTNDLFFALVICGLPCCEFAELAENGKLRRQLKRWGKRVRKFIDREKYFSILEKIEAFKRYLEQGSEVHWKVLFRQDNSETSPTHWSHSIEVTLRSKVGWTAEEIEEQPLTKAMQDFFKYMEGEGIVKLVDPDHYEAMQAEGRANAEALAKIFGGKL